MTSVLPTRARGWRGHPAAKWPGRDLNQVSPTSQPSPSAVRRCLTLVLKLSRHLSGSPEAILGPYLPVCSQHLSLATQQSLTGRDSPHPCGDSPHPSRAPLLLAALPHGASKTQGRVSHTGAVTAAALQGMSSPEPTLEK